MKTLFSALAVSAVVLGFASGARAQVSFGITIGPPPPPRMYHVPPQPGPDYDWVEGYWYPAGSHYRWHDGYWTRPPYAGSYWVEPYYDGRQYHAGRWEGRGGNVMHNHRWDRGRQRDEGRFRPHDDRGDDRHEHRDESRDHR